MPGFTPNENFMANSLNRNLKKGDKVVLNGGLVAVCGGECFGSLAFTSGTCLDVTIDGQFRRADGFDIDAEATLARFSKENGWQEAAAQS